MAAQVVCVVCVVSRAAYSLSGLWCSKGCPCWFLGARGCWRAEACRRRTGLNFELSVERKRTSELAQEWQALSRSLGCRGRRQRRRRRRQADKRQRTRDPDTKAGADAGAITVAGSVRVGAGWRGERRERDVRRQERLGVGRARGKISGGQTKRQMDVVEFSVPFLIFIIFLVFFFKISGEGIVLAASRMTSGKLLEITGRDEPGGLPQRGKRHARPGRFQVGKEKRTRAGWVGSRCSNAAVQCRSSAVLLYMQPAGAASAEVVWSTS